MASETQVAPVSKKMFWGGVAMSVLPVGMLCMSGIMKVLNTAQVVEGFKTMGFPDGLGVPLGTVELLCTVLYAGCRRRACLARSC